MNPQKQAKHIESNASERLKDLIIESIQEKKGEDIISIDLRNLHESVTDFFVICHATSTVQVKAIADYVSENLKKAKGEKVWHSEGFGPLEWVLLDYVSVVVHIFLKEKREIFALADLWSDAPVSHYE